MGLTAGENGVSIPIRFNYNDRDLGVLFLISPFQFQ